MNVLAHLVITALLVAALIILRVLTERGVTRQRLRSGLACDESTCFGGCHARDGDSARRPGQEKSIESIHRSADHAPR